jgi:3-phenylpropionate/cinnamic acid dioxygenase small subunit
MTDAVTVLAAKHDIVDVLVTYAYALDERDWDGLQRCFTPDAVVHYGEEQVHGPAVVTALRALLEPLALSQHLIGNIVLVVAPDGDTATSCCYAQAQHVRPGVEGGDQYLLGARYRDRLAPTANGWRIIERTLDVLRAAGDEAVLFGSK